MQKKVSVKQIAILLISFVFFIPFLFQKAGAEQNFMLHQVSPSEAASYSANKMSFKNCFKNYPICSENLFYSALSALNNADYKIEEIQYSAGTIRFEAYTLDFCLIVSKIDNKNSFIKIIPVDDNYNFAPVIIQRIFEYLDYNYQVITQQLI